VLLVAPMSGHFATLLRGTAQTLLADHDVYLSDWHNARDIGLRQDEFGFDEFIDHVTTFLQVLGPGVHVVGVCQPWVRALLRSSLPLSIDRFAVGRWGFLCRPSPKDRTRAGSKGKLVREAKIVGGTTKTLASAQIGLAVKKGACRRQRRRRCRTRYWSDPPCGHRAAIVFGGATAARSPANVVFSRSKARAMLTVFFNHIGRCIPKVDARNRPIDGDSPWKREIFRAAKFPFCSAAQRVGNPQLRRSNTLSSGRRVTDRQVSARRVWGSAY
jgi:hypothetical protein